MRGVVVLRRGVHRARLPAPGMWCPPPALAQGTEGLGDAEPALAVMLLLRVVCCRGCLAPKG